MTLISNTLQQRVAASPPDVKPTQLPAEPPATTTTASDPAQAGQIPPMVIPNVVDPNNGPAPQQPTPQDYNNAIAARLAATVGTLLVPQCSQGTAPA
eukprot:2477867-Alexandrium_andersonii.AAC.1